MSPNLFLLAADKPIPLLKHLRSLPDSLARKTAAEQDDHGYSLVHAAASYSHLDLLRALVGEFGVPVDLRDEDGETALFSTETVAVARVLVEELKLDPALRGDSGLTAREAMEAESENAEVVEYLRGLDGKEQSQKKGDDDDGKAGQTGETEGTAVAPEALSSTRLPEGMALTVGTMDDDAGPPLEPDSEFRRRIEQLAQRDDFDGSEGQAELRKLVEDVLESGVVKTDERARTRQRQS